MHICEKRSFAFYTGMFSVDNPPLQPVSAEVLPRTPSDSQ